MPGPLGFIVQIHIVHCHFRIYDVKTRPTVSFFIIFVTMFNCFLTKGTRLDGSVLELFSKLDGIETVLLS